MTRRPLWIQKCVFLARLQMVPIQSKVVRERCRGTIAAWSQATRLPHLYPWHLLFLPPRALRTIPWLRTSAPQVALSSVLMHLVAKGQNVTVAPSSAFACRATAVPTASWTCVAPPAAAPTAPALLLTWVGSCLCSDWLVLVMMAGPDHFATRALASKAWPRIAPVAVTARARRLETRTARALATQGIAGRHARRPAPASVKVAVECILLDVLGHR